MTRTLGKLTLEEAAKEAAGNWQNFDSFIWYRRNELDEPANWALIYTHNRDSGLLDQSNAYAIERALEPFTGSDDPDVVFESHSHWAVGHVDGFSIRVYRDTQITDAFKTYHELMEQLDGYPVLDDEDYSNREYEATLDNLTDAAWRLKNDFVLPLGWEGDVYVWLSDNNCGAIENRDDQGGYPDADELQQAFESLDYQRLT